MNAHLVANTPDNRMITFFYGELDPATGQLTYVNAGHNPPYLYDESGFTKLNPTGVVLGLIDHAPFAEASVQKIEAIRKGSGTRRRQHHPKTTPLPHSTLNRNLPTMKKDTGADKG